MRRLALALLILLSLTACSTKETPALAQAPAAPAAENVASGESNTDAGRVGGADAVFSLDDYDDEPMAVSDPLEPWNRMWFHVNEFLLLDVLKPVHVAYTNTVPAPLRSGLSNFRHNLLSPVRFLNSLLQGKFGQAGVEFGRFFINTVTSLGFVDVAARDKPLFPYHPETANFEHTLAVWGLPEGFYLVWPFLGPSTLRGTAGMAGDAFMTPQSYALPLAVSAGSTLGLTFNELDTLYTPYEQMKRISIEPYVALRNAYLTLIRERIAADKAR